MPDLVIGTETLRLPVRIVPRKEIQVIYFGFFLAFALITLPMLYVPRTSPAFYVMLVFMLPFGVIGVCGCLTAVLKSLPQSPYFNIEIDAETFTLRRGFRVRRFQWSELAPFAVSAFQNEDSSKVFDVAILSADSGRRYSDLEFYHAALANLGDYCENDETATSDMVACLNTIRSAALERGAALKQIAVPFACEDRAFEVERRGSRSRIAVEG